MDGNFKLSNDDIDIETQDALELFYAGIRAIQTRATMDRMLKKFLDTSNLNLIKSRK